MSYEITPKSAKKTNTFVPSVAGGPVARVDLLFAGARRVSLPQQPAGASIETDRHELLAADRRHEDAIARQRGRRVAERQIGLPYQVPVRTELDRQARARRDAGAVRSAEARPAFRIRYVSESAREQSNDRSGNHRRHR
jgi:hypothetical protein